MGVRTYFPSRSLSFTTRGAVAWWLLLVEAVLVWEVLVVVALAAMVDPDIIYYMICWEG